MGGSGVSTRGSCSLPAGEVGEGGLALQIWDSGLLTVVDECLPFCVDESEPPFYETCLSLGAACPSSLPIALPGLVPSQARQVPCKPHPAQPLSAAHCALCPALTLLLAPWGWPPTTPLVCSSPQLQHHPTVPLQACHPWATCLLSLRARDSTGGRNTVQVAGG